MSSTGRASRCPVCGGAELRPAFPAAARRVKSELARCARCRLVFQTSPADERELLSLYSDEYYEHWGVAEDFDGVFELKRRSARRYLEALLDRWTRQGSGRLLDVGCAFGFLLTAARELGFGICGLEVSPAGKYAATALGCPVYATPTELEMLPAGHLAVVTMVDVLEHLPDPVGSMLALTRILEPGGAMLIVTPDVNSAAARLRPGAWPHFKDEHVCYYSRSSLSALFSTCGLRMVHCAPTSRYLTLEYIAGHFRRYDSGSWVSRLLCALTNLLPDRLVKRPFLLPTELLTIAVK